MLYAFGPYQLDTGRRQIRTRNERMRIEPKMIEVLAYLIQHRDRVVTKGELLEAVWDGAPVGESVLFKCVSTLRKMLGEGRSRSDLIRTYYGRGYRFVAPVFEKRWPEGSSLAPNPSAPVAAASSAHAYTSVL